MNENHPIIGLDSPKNRLKIEDVFSPPNGRVRSYTDADSLTQNRDYWKENEVRSTERRERSQSFSAPSNSQDSKASKSKRWSIFGKKKKEKVEENEENSFQNSEGEHQFQISVNPDITGDKLERADQQNVKGVSLSNIQNEFYIKFNDKSGNIAVGTLEINDNSVDIYKSKNLKKKAYYSLDLKCIRVHRYAEDNRRVMFHYLWPAGSEGKTNKKAVFHDNCEIITVETEREADKVKYAMRVAIERGLERRESQRSLYHLPMSSA
eukprot:TRINITY_DN850_c0_g1_i1.p1 TRINITY_DN850_c0_g1~~TRINITY_DN850_c0_g1_i1.p1  ORF type:complete len:265 (-),score=67.35 TRINITY_DN850_c0_g1_i1:41-835(-)